MKSIKTKVDLHLLSDSSPSLLASASRFIKSRFPNVHFSEYVWSILGNEKRLSYVLDEISTNSFLIYYFDDRSLALLTKKKCAELSIPCTPLIDHIINKMSQYFEESPQQHFVQDVPGLDKNYFDIMDAINYAIRHDDGQNVEEILHSDIILVGASRTSKSPTSIYLAYSSGYKVANIPFIYGINLPNEINCLKNNLVIGLTINPNHLSKIRKRRMQIIQPDDDNTYYNNSCVARELSAALKVFNQNGWPVIDVTLRSVEEIAGTVIQYYNKNKSEN